jgi:hypothetical protein
MAEKCNSKPNNNIGMTCRDCFSKRPQRQEVQVPVAHGEPEHVPEPDESGEEGVAEAEESLPVQLGDGVEVLSEQEEQEPETEITPTESGQVSVAIAEEPLSEEESLPAVDDAVEELVDDAVEELAEERVDEPVNDAVQEQVSNEVIGRTTGVPRGGVLSVHLTPTKKKRKMHGETTGYKQQGRCRVCKAKTTYNCSLCMEVQATSVGRRFPGPWFCHFETGRMCFSVHMQQAHPLPTG